MRASLVGWLLASLLDAEAGVSSSTASNHLRKLLDAGLLAVERHGRNRYYRLAGPQVGQLIEVLIQFAPPHPIRSQGTRAYALRAARICYDHLAGRLGVDLTRTLLDRQYLIGGDGTFNPTDSASRSRRGEQSSATAWAGAGNAITWPAPPVEDYSLASSNST